MTEDTHEESCIGPPKRGAGGPEVQQAELH